MKSLLMRMEEEREKAGLKLNQKTKIMATGPINSWKIKGQKVEAVTDTLFLAPKSLQTVTTVMKLKHACCLKGKLGQTQCFKKQRHHLANKGPYSQSYSFSNSRVQR